MLSFQKAWAFNFPSARPARMRAGFVSRRKLISRVSAFAAMGLVLGIFIAGAQPDAASLLPFPWNKFAHLAFYSAFALLLHLGLKRRLLGALIGTALLAAADEIHQYWLPGRNASFNDWCLNMLGAVLCLTLVRLLVKLHWRNR